MIVCICKGASDREIRSVIEGGAKCLDSLERSGIGGDCRCCEDTLLDMLRDCAGGDADACRACCRTTATQASA